MPSLLTSSVLLTPLLLIFFFFFISVPLCFFFHFLVLISRLFVWFSFWVDSSALFLLGSGEPIACSPFFLMSYFVDAQFKNSTPWTPLTVKRYQNVRSTRADSKRAGLILRYQQEACCQIKCCLVQHDESIGSERNCTMFFSWDVLSCLCLCVYCLIMYIIQPITSPLINGVWEFPTNFCNKHGHWVWIVLTACDIVLW